MFLKNLNIFYSVIFMKEALIIRVIYYDLY